MSRNTLHIKHLAKFKDWLTASDVYFRDGRGTYEVIQVRIREQSNGWACIYWRHEMPEHYTVDRRLESLVRKFLRDRKSGTPQAIATQEQTQ